MPKFEEIAHKGRCDVCGKQTDVQYALHPAGRSVLRTAAAAWRLDWNPMGSCSLIFPAPATGPTI